jgi:hypothetical protein
MVASDPVTERFRPVSMPIYTESTMSSGLCAGNNVERAISPAGGSLITWVANAKIIPADAAVTGCSCAIQLTEKCTRTS